MGYPLNLGSLASVAPEFRLHGFWQYTPAVAENSTDGEGSSGDGHLQMLLSPRKTSRPDNLVEQDVQGVGGWGGMCTCPDGQVYQVGENLDGCASLACVNGVSGPCGPRNPGGAGVRVTCAQDFFADGTDEKPSCSEGPGADSCHEGQRCISSDLQRNECPPAGCDLDTDRCLGDARVSFDGSSSSSNEDGDVDWCEHPPAKGANMTIAAGSTATLSGCTTALLNRIDIFGTLRFVDGAVSTLRAQYIHVAAYTGRLEAGTTDSPFMSEARIQLYGRRSTPSYPNSGLGSKFLAVFGELSLVGRCTACGMRGLHACGCCSLAYLPTVSAPVCLCPPTADRAPRHPGLSSSSRLRLGAVCSV